MVTEAPIQQVKEAQAMLGGGEGKSGVITKKRMCILTFYTKYYDHVKED